jgi:hypothetical protein
MLVRCLRIWVFLATLVASLHVSAETQYWTLTGVQLEDGAVATGYFSYDDATRTIANWNLRFSGGAGSFIPHTYVPGNSAAGPITRGSGVPPYLVFRSLDMDPRFEGFIRTTRVVWIAPLAPLDGNSATVSIHVSFYTSGELFEDHDFHTIDSRVMTAGSLMLTTLPPPVTNVQVDEFYHPGLRHYFITADPAEKQLLDTGVHPGWERTGEIVQGLCTSAFFCGDLPQT